MIQGAIEKSQMLLSQYCKKKKFMAPYLFIIFGRTNNICASCISQTHNDFIAPKLNKMRLYSELA